MMPAAAVQIAT